MKQTLSILLMTACCAVSANAQTQVKSGDKIAFLGDSITQQGNQAPAGYIHLVMDGLREAGILAEAVPAGISGHKSNDMLARLDRDVIAKNPQWMTLSCGVNDVWHFDFGPGRGVSLEDFKANITQIVDKAQAAGIHVVILTATMVTEDASASKNITLAGYNDFLRKLAAERKLPLTDLNADMQALVAQKPAGSGNLLTRDGVHMNLSGNIMMAKGILRTFGVSEDVLTKCEARWKTL